MGRLPSGAVLDLGSLRSPAGKKALIAHFDGGARYVARILIGEISLAIVCAPNSPFSAVKMGGPFSLRCLSPLCSPAVGTGQTQRNASWDVSAEIGWLRSAKKRASFFLYNWHCTYSTNGAGMIRCCLDIFATQKASVISYPRWPFMRAMRPVAEWRSFLFNWRFTTPNPRGPLPSGGNSAANPQIPRVPRALRARCGVQGVTPCCEP